MSLKTIQKHSKVKMKKWKSYPILIIALLLIITGTACQPDKKVESNPNIIIILLDDLGYGDFSIYQQDNKIKTPNIDRIAQEGIRFTDAHTPSSVCTPTRYGLLTGRYNWRTKLKSGVLNGKSKALIPNSRTTIASILKKKNYNTAFIGKWHLGWNWSLKNEKDESGKGWNEKDFDIIDFTKPVTNTPNDLGFDYSYGHSGSLDMAPYVYVENGKVTAVPDTTTVNTGKYSWWRKGPTAKDFIHEEVTPNFFNKSINYIQEQSKTESPFFLYLPLPSPHTPILPSEEWKGKSGLNPYGDFVLMIDDYIGKLLDELDNQKIADNTMIVLSSDNGCSPAAKIDELVTEGHYPNSIYRGHKADIYEGGHRVPFIVRWPDKIKAGLVSEETICLTDLMSTFADIVDYDLKDNEGEDSYSLLPILERKAFKAPLREATVHHSINGSFAIRKENWKLIMCPGSGGWSFPRPDNTEAIDTLPRIQLYNLSDDPKETTNLMASQPEKVKDLQALLTQYIRQGRSTPGAPQKNDPIDFEWKQIQFTTK
jgi:arylsulfatase A-like enzyme